MTLTPLNRSDIDSIQNPNIKDSVIHTKKVAGTPELDEEMSKTSGKTLRISMKFGDDVPKNLKKKPVELRGQCGSDTFWNEGKLQNSTLSSDEKRIFIVNITPVHHDHNFSFKLLINDDEGNPHWQFTTANNANNIVPLQNHGQIVHLKMRDVHFQ